jgi:hypothetical protein
MSAVVEDLDDSEVQPAPESMLATVRSFERRQRLLALPPDQAAHELVMFSKWCYFQRRDRTPSRRSHPSHRPSLLQSIVEGLVEATPVQAASSSPEQQLATSIADLEELTELQDINPAHLHDSMNLTIKIKHFEALLEDLGREDRVTLCYSDDVLALLSVDHVIALMRDIPLETLAQIVPKVCPLPRARGP